MKKIIKMSCLAFLMGVSTNIFATSNEQIGTVVGGIAGGLIGNNISHGSGRTAATIGGAVIGSLVGNQVGSNADAENYQNAHCDRYCHWETIQRPIHHYTPQYRNTFIGNDGRLCRRSVLTNDYGDRIVATYCCYRSTPRGYCTRWIRVS